jgi:mannose-6-phosphate isomerase-like protein (cupin superfamily)
MLPARIERNRKEDKMAGDVMQSFELDGLLERHQAAGNLWMEFLRVPSLSAGIYRLPAGSVDPQKPHTEDEVYYVISGRGSFTCEGTTVPANTGSTIYVAANAEHRFHDITEDLTILVLFAPAEIE